MTFLHEPFFFEDLESVTNPETGKRQYTTPQGNQYDSVTTILGSGPKPELEAWRNRIGHVAADAYTQQSAERGTRVHKIYEDFVNNILVISEHDPFTYALFKSSMPYLTDGLTKVHNLEFALYSDILKTAGRCDLLCQWYGEIAILDYKTSKYAKKKEWITDYFIQLALYALMVYELKGIICKKLVVFIVNETDPEPQIFVEDVSKWIAIAMKKVKDYHGSIN